MPRDAASFITPCLPVRFNRPPNANLCPRCSANLDREGKLSRRAFLATLLNATLLLSKATSAVGEQSAPASGSDTSAPTTSEQPSPHTLKRGKRPTWGYDKENGPSVWHTLSPDWQLAETGELQSPIPLSYKTATLEDANSPDRPRLQTTTSKLAGRLRPLPNAAQPTLQLQPYVPPPPPVVGDAPPLDIYKSPPPPAVIYTEDSSYELKAIHFHAGRTEHEIGGWSGSLETHFCFERRDGAFVSREEGEDKVETEETVEREDVKETVEVQREPKKADKDRKAPKYLNLAFLGEQAQSSPPWLSTFLKTIRLRNEEDVSVVVSMEMGNVIPNFEECDIYTYTGSFTTPPCSEGVQWLVLSSRMPVAEEDVMEIMRMQGGENVRPLQQINGRRVSRFPALKLSSEKDSKVTQK
ncbi:carbonic anhydrase [Gracilaria domingensis]|nr:carbonic anhydrase [Gracilaria domingensis]